MNSTILAPVPSIIGDILTFVVIRQLVYSDKFIPHCN